MENCGNIGVSMLVSRFCSDLRLADSLSEPRTCGLGALVMTVLPRFSKKAREAPRGNRGKGVLIYLLVYECMCVCEPPRNQRKTWKFPLHKSNKLVHMNGTI